MGLAAELSRLQWRMKDALIQVRADEEAGKDVSVDYLTGRIEGWAEELDRLADRVCALEEGVRGLEEALAGLVEAYAR